MSTSIMISGTPRLLSPVFQELSNIAPLLPPGLPHRAPDSGLLDRIPSPDENQPPLDSTPIKKFIFHQINRDPLSDITKLYDIILIEASQGTPPSKSSTTTTSCPTPPNSPVRIDPKPRSTTAQCSSGVDPEKSDAHIFDPFSDDPAGPTRRLPPKFQGSLSELWPQRRRVPFSATSTILYSSGRLLPRVSGLSPTLSPSESRFSFARRVLPEFNQVGQGEAMYFLPGGPGEGAL